MSTLTSKISGLWVFSADRLMEACGDDPPQREADGGAGKHRAGVERGPEPGDQSFSKRSTLTMKTVAPPTWTSTG